MNSSHRLSSVKGNDFGDSDLLSKTLLTDTTPLNRRVEELSHRSPSFNITWLNNARPYVFFLVDAFISETVEKGRIRVIDSGPPELGKQLRTAVAAKNVPGDVGRGDEARDVECVLDDRIG